MNGLFRSLKRVYSIFNIFESYSQADKVIRVSMRDNYTLNGFTQTISICSKLLGIRRRELSIKQYQFVGAFNDVGCMEGIIAQVSMNLYIILFVNLYGALR